LFIFIVNARFLFLSPRSQSPLLVALMPFFVFMSRQFLQQVGYSILLSRDMFVGLRVLEGTARGSVGRVLIAERLHALPLCFEGFSLTAAADPFAQREWARSHLAF
jgi:hypothetical protein